MFSRAEMRQVDFIVMRFMDYILATKLIYLVFTLILRRCLLVLHLLDYVMYTGKKLYLPSFFISTYRIF